MRDKLLFYLFTAGAMLTIPALSLLPSGTANAGILPSADTSVSPEFSENTQKCYRVLDAATGTVSEMPVRDYLIGAVCAEMPANYETEALKAQTVAVHSYAERIAARNRQSPDAALHGADFSNDANVYQGYYTEAELRTAYGDAFDANYAKVAAAVDAVADKLLCYEGEPIVAAFHAISAGKTESAENIWGEPIAYLTAVDSPADTAAPHFLEAVTFSADAVREKLQALGTGLQLPDDPALWIRVTASTDAGTVTAVQCGNLVFTGQQMRSAFGLRSACFTVAYSADGQFAFTTKGYGHGVGMSQYGANAMAQNGSSYEEILAHYYPNAALV